MTKLRWYLLVLAAFAALVSGCSNASGPSADPTPTPFLPTADLTMRPGESSVPALTDPASWTLRPGGFGPVEIGMTAVELRALGLIRRAADRACGQRWEEAGRLRALGIGLEFRDGDADDLDQVFVVLGRGGDTTWSTDRGFELGHSVENLRRLYGTELHTGDVLPEGGTKPSYYLVDEQGSLTFGAEDGPVDLALVTGLTAAGGYRAPRLGC